MKTKLPFALVLILLVSAVALAQEASPSPSPSPKPAMSRAQSQKLIVATEKKLWEAWKTKNLKMFQASLSADSLMIGDSGVSSKKDILGQMEAMQCDVKSYVLSDLKVTFLNSSAALLTYKATQEGTCAGQALPATVWASSAYVQRGGKWYAASHQETPGK